MYLTFFPVLNSFDFQKENIFVIPSDVDVKFLIKYVQEPIFSIKHILSSQVENLE